MYSIIPEGDHFAIQCKGRTVMGPLTLYDAREVARVLNQRSFEVNKSLPRAPQMSGQSGVRPKAEPPSSGTWDTPRAGQRCREHSPWAKRAKGGVASKKAE